LNRTISKKTYLDDTHKIVDESNATCWFAYLHEDGGQIIGEVFGLITKSINAQSQ
jgi:hypothetical protein